jgi:TolA-binding protein
MKSNLIRLMTIATLATSISAFAATNETKSGAATTTVSTQQQEGCSTSVSKDNQEKKAAKPQRNEQNDKDFDRSLLGIYG